MNTGQVSYEEVLKARSSGFGRGERVGGEACVGCCWLSLVALLLCRCVPVGHEVPRGI